MKPPTPPPSDTFLRKKASILSQLSVPDSEYIDASPKGSVDVGIRTLIDELNARDGLVTTSSCAGRVSVYLEGRKKNLQEGDLREAQAVGASAVGGKGGGEWLFVSHDPFEGKGGEGVGYGRVFGLEGEIGNGGMGEGERLIHFKFEPMILHVLTASPQHAQLVVQAGMEAGFRETGAVSLVERRGDEAAMPVVAVRSMGLSFESLIGVEKETGGVGRERVAIVTSEYLEMLVQIANERFVENEKRIARFQAALKTAFEPRSPAKWEDAEARRERKRAEGLRRREALEKEKAAQTEDHLDLGMILQ